jgi:hypothetical protein
MDLGWWFEQAAAQVVQQAEPVGQAPVTAEVTARRFRVASLRTALVLGEDSRLVPLLVILTDWGLC